MATAIDNEEAIKALDRESLIRLWDDKASGTFDETFWGKGKLLENLIVRAFELEEATVNYPYSIRQLVEIAEGNRNIELEQIDGSIHIQGYHALIECKDYTQAKIDVTPLAKMRNQLMRRHSPVFGMFFSETSLTPSADALLKYMAPQLIIVWDKDDIDFCLRNNSFFDCLKWKYEAAISKCEYNISYKRFKNMDYLDIEPLF